MKGTFITDRNFKLCCGEPAWPDARTSQEPPGVQGSLCDYVLSGTFERFPKLRIAYAEGQVGWMPYVIERMDKLWEERDADTTSGIDR